MNHAKSNELSIFSSFQEILYQTKFLSEALLSAKNSCCLGTFELFFPSLSKGELSEIIQFLYFGQIKTMKSLNEKEIILENLVSLFGFPVDIFDDVQEIQLDYCNENSLNSSQNDNSNAQKTRENGSKGSGQSETFQNDDTRELQMQDGIPDFEDCDDFNQNVAMQPEKDTKNYERKKVKDEKELNDMFQGSKFKISLVFDKNLDGKHIQDIEPPLKCKICNKKYFKLRKLKNHEKFMHKGLGETMNSSLKSEKFYKNSKENKPVHCKLCDQKFSTTSDFFSHMKVLHKMKLGKARWRNICTVCFEIQDSKEHLVDHMKKVHAMKRLLKCQICEKLFKDERKLSGHHNRRHQIKVCLKRVDLSEGNLRKMNLTLRK